MLPQTPPMAEGDLAQTPFAHLAVYLLDRRLTGELFVVEPETEVTHALRFERGMPVKVRMGDGYARLGELLVEEELVTADVVEGAVLTGGLLGDVLVLSGKVESAQLEEVLDRQFRLRMARMFELPVETTFKYFDGSDTLKDYGGDPASIDPLELLWQGIRENGEKSAFFEPTIERLSGTDLKLHPQACIERFNLEEDALLIAEVISLEPLPISGLYEVEGISPDIINKFVYLLAITRQLDLGRGALPVGAEPKSSSSLANLAKVRLESRVHRVGAAVDAPGDGERSVRSVKLKGRTVIPRNDESVPPPATVEKPAAAEPAAQPATDATPPVAAEAPAAAAEGSKPAEPAKSAAPSKPGGPTKPAEPQAAKGPKPPSAPRPEVSPAAAAEAASSEPGEESSRRLVSDTIRALPVPALMKLAREKIHEKEATMAAAVCETALKKVTEAGQLEELEGLEVRALHVWARSLDSHPELKSLAVELDDLVRQRDDVATSRFVRGLLRMRLGNEASAESDFRRVLELEPGHEGARRELRAVETAGVKRGESGFLKRLLRR
ncbi:MAG: hypothetical protein IPM79_27045 [Polyangiaceae bacterium]|nr:hypothetical protein [Polyangiaceae bacterium]